MGHSLPLISPDTTFSSVEASIAQSVNAVSRVLDSKMYEFETRLDRQMGIAAATIAATTAAAATSQQQQQQQQGVAMGRGFPTAAAAGASSYGYGGAATPPPSNGSGSAPPPQQAASETLVFLTLSKADAAEKATSELKANLLVGTSVESVTSL